MARVDPAEVAALAERIRMAGGDYAHPMPRRRVMLPVVLLLATCASTFFAAASDWLPAYYLGSFDRAGHTIAQHWQQGLIYMAAVMGILLTHEMGHFLMTVRYRIPASLPFFIPMPMVLFGTMGAVIGMDRSRADRRQMFDQGIAGPLAGLAVALPVTWVGILQLQANAPMGDPFGFYCPLIFRLMIDTLRPDMAGTTVLYLGQFNAFLMAGFVGMFVTGLNMLPIGQLDGGHVTYALLGRRAHILARAVLIGAILFIVIAEKHLWVLMVVLITLIGTDHPPTANDRAKLGPWRTALGWVSLAIPIFCFHPLVFRFGSSP